MLDLISEIRHDAVNLLDHRLREDLDLNANFNSRYSTTGHSENRQSKRVFSGNEFTKRSVTTPSPHTLSHVLNIYNSFVILDAGNEFLGLMEIVKILIQFNRDRVADRRVSVLIPSSFKDVSKSFK
jgi:hypothetical protein